MATEVTEKPTRRFQREGTEADVQRRICGLMTEACAELSDELKKQDLEFVAVMPDQHYSTRIADFRFQHVSDRHEIGFFRAIAFVPVGTNDLKGNIVLKAFSVLLQLYLDTVRESITINEESLLETLDERMRFKQQLVDIIRAAVKKWAK